MKIYIDDLNQNIKFDEIHVFNIFNIFNSMQGVREVTVPWSKIVTINKFSK